MKSEPVFRVIEREVDTRSPLDRLRELDGQLTEARNAYAMGVISRLKDALEMTEHAAGLAALSPGVREECRHLSEHLRASISRLGALGGRK